MNKTVLIPLTTALIILCASLGFAGSPRDGSHGPGANARLGRGTQILDQLTPEKRALFDSILAEHRRDVRPLRNKLWQKRTELQALSPNPNTKPETLSAIVAEMADLRAQVQTKRDALRERVKKEVGIDLPARGRGFGDGRHDGHHGLGLGHGFDGPDTRAGEADETPGV